MSLTATNFWKPGANKPQNSIQEPTNSLKINQETTSTLETTTNSATKPTLSKSVMTMKFMKRKEEEISDKLIENEVKRSRLSIESNKSSKSYINDMDISDNPITNISNDSPYIIEEDAPLLYPGRRSFGGCNKIVEKQYQTFLDEQKFTTSTTKSSNEEENDEKIIEKYKDLISLPRGPNQGMKPKESNFRPKSISQHGQGRKR